MFADTVQRLADNYADATASLFQPREGCAQARVEAKQWGKKTRRFHFLAGSKNPARKSPRCSMFGTSPDRFRPRGPELSSGVKTPRRTSPRCSMLPGSTKKRGVKKPYRFCNYLNRNPSL